MTETKAEPNIKNNNINTDKDISDLITSISNTERENAINNVLNALKINPIDILNVNINYSKKELKKQYHKLSLLIHPDKCPEYLKDNSVKAFAKLSSAKKLLEDDDYIVKLKAHIIEAKRRIVEKNMIKKSKEFLNNNNNNDNNDNINEPPRKKMKLNSNDDISNGINNDINNNDSNDNSNDIESINENEWKQELREVLIDEAWQKRIETKAANKLHEQQLIHREKLKEMIKEQKLRKKEWENGREKRVNSWRDWNNKNNKKKKKKRKRNH
mmetsp:Transcript_95764/g.117367  ORF Transcript_95764/g.117367 Transcript_95764/m.117367 type:complete len:271 (-) Transcript_95764:22-834(-)